MARPTKKALLARVAKALEDDGWRVEQLTAADVYPATFQVQRGRRTHRLRIYIWNLTHGGGARRPKHEFRIQVTSGVTRFEQVEGEQTVILGWSDEFGVFAGFDILFHSKALGRSPSMQINSAALLRAIEAGIASRTRKNGEIAVAIRPDLLGDYIDQVPNFHNEATAERRIAAVQKAVFSDRKKTVEIDIDRENAAIQAQSRSGQKPRFGDPNENAQRRTIIDRLEALEREIERLKPADGKIGHNQPPEPMEIELPKETRDEVLNASRAIKEELAKSAPDTQEIAKRAGILQKAAGTLRSIREEAGKFRDKLKEKVREKAVEAVIGGTLAVGGIFQSDVRSAVGAALHSIGLWFKMLF